MTATNCGAAVAPDFSNIDALAAEFSRWCCWRYEGRGEGKKPAKTPYGAARRLDTTKPLKWLGYAEARRMYEGGGFDGVGVLMTGNDRGIVAFDVDGCLGDDGQVVAEHEAVAALVAMGSYVEVSPSGHGLRGFILGAKPAGCREKVGAVEVYDSGTRGRYVSITGVPWGGAGRPIAAADVSEFLRRFGFVDWDDDEEDGEGAVEVEGDDDDDSEIWPEVDDDELLRLLKRNNKRGAVTRLLAGDTTGYAGDSEARAALIGHAAWFSRDIEQLDRLMRGSGLMKPKLDEKRGREPFSVWEIRRLLEGKDDSRSYWSDQAAKKASGAIEKAAAKGLSEKAREFLVGGLDGITTPKGKIRADIYAQSELLVRDCRLIGAVWFDAFAMMPMKTAAFGAMGVPSVDSGDVLTDQNYRLIEMWLAREWGVALRPGDVKRIAAAWADRTTRNPIIERLDDFAAKWDGESRVGGLLTRYFGAKPVDEDLAHFYAEVGRMFLVSVVARAMNPGAKVDTLMVLESEQGSRKSSGVEALASAISHRAFIGDFNLGNLDKDSKLRLRGRILGECAELDGMSRHDANTLKNFLSTRRDHYRDPYGLATMDWPRTIVLVGTTNEASYLRDPTGNRRYWCVRVGRVNLKAIVQDAAQVWGEAVHLYRAGARWWIEEQGDDDRRLRTIQQREALKRMAPDTWTEIVEDFNERLVLGSVKNPRNDDIKADPMMSWRLVDLMAAVFDDGGRDRRTQQEEIRFRTALHRAGWEHNGSSAHGRWKLGAEGRAAALDRTR